LGLAGGLRQSDSALLGDRSYVAIEQIVEPERSQRAWHPQDSDAFVVGRRPVNCSIVGRHAEVAMQNLEFKINPDVYLAQMHQQTAASLAELRNTVRALADGSFAQRAAAPRPAGVVSFSLDNIQTADQDAVSRACASCFLGLVRSLITFIDRMVATKRCVGQSVQIPTAVSTLAELQAFLANQVEETYTSVARDTRLTNPVKLKSLGVASDFVNNAALSYFALRRCLEHHAGILDKDINLLYFKSTIFCGEEEVTQVPFVAKEGANVSIKFDEAERVFHAGDKVQLTEYEIEQVFFTIQSVMGPQIRQTVGGP
jgi:hypothetical protein